MMRSIRASATIIISLSVYFNTYEARPIAGMQKNVELQRNEELESTRDDATEVVQERAGSVSSPIKVSWWFGMNRDRPTSPSPLRESTISSTFNDGWWNKLRSSYSPMVSGSTTYKWWWFSSSSTLPPTTGTNSGWFWSWLLDSKVSTSPQGIDIAGLATTPPHWGSSNIAVTAPSTADWWDSVVNWFDSFTFPSLPSTTQYTQTTSIYKETTDWWDSAVAWWNNLFETDTETSFAPTMSFTQSPAWKTSTPVYMSDTLPTTTDWWDSVMNWWNSDSHSTIASAIPSSSDFKTSTPVYMSDNLPTTTDWWDSVMNWWNSESHSTIASVIPSSSDFRTSTPVYMSDNLPTTTDWWDSVMNWWNSESHSTIASVIPSSSDFRTSTPVYMSDNSATTTDWWDSVMNWWNGQIDSTA